MFLITSAVIHTQPKPQCLGSTAGSKTHSWWRVGLRQRSVIGGNQETFLMDYAHHREEGKGISGHLSANSDAPCLSAAVAS